MTYLRHPLDSYRNKTKAGVPGDADFATVPGDGVVAIDTAAKVLYFRAGGTWQAPAGGVGGGTELAPAYKTGNYYVAGGGTAVSTNSHGLATLSTTMIWLPAGVAIDRVGIECTTLGAGATYRLGIYNDNGGMQPGTLLVDFGVAYGSLDCSTTGVKEYTLSPASTIAAAGWYWFAGATQGATCTCRATTGAALPFLPSFGTASPGTIQVAGFATSAGVVAGALPGTFPAVIVQGTTTRFFFRVG